eukprot:962545-Pleurochrysis_carterae.AAC.5
MGGRSDGREIGLAGNRIRHQGAARKKQSQASGARERCPKALKDMNGLAGRHEQTQRRRIRSE